MDRIKRPARRIWAQGDADSACFLYCLVNAAFLLSGKEVTPAKWKKAISQMPVRADDFLSGEGTGRIGDHPESLQKLAESFMKSLGASVETEVIHGISSHRKLAKSVAADQVVILGITNGSHWVVIAETAGPDIYYACSAQALNDAAPYREDISPSLGRVYNGRSSLADLAVWDQFALVLKGTLVE